MPAALKFSLLGPQLRPFRNALAALGKIGAELLIEALPEQLNMRAINTSRSACLSVMFAANFFDTYELSQHDAESEVLLGLQAACLMKQMAAVFRTQRISRLSFTLDPEILAACIDCENGLRKTFRVPCTDGEMVVAAVDRDNMAICVTVRADEMNRLLSSFQASLLEMSIIAQLGRQCGRDVRFVSYMDPAKGHAERHVHTELDLSNDVLLAFTNASNAAADATFNVRDFKAMVALCEVIHAHVAISFDRAGDPMVVAPQPTGRDGLEQYMRAELVLATLMDSQLALFADEPPCQSTGRPPPPSTGRIRTPATEQTPSAMAAAPRHAASGAAGGSGGGPGPSTLGPQSARRDLNSAMRRVQNASPHGTADGSADPSSASLRGTFGAAGEPLHDGNASRKGPASGGLQQQQQQQLQEGDARQQAIQHQAAVRHIEGPGAMGSMQPGDDDDEGLDDYASLQTPSHWGHLGIVARGSFHEADVTTAMARPADAYDEFDDQEEDEEVPGTPPR